MSFTHQSAAPSGARSSDREGSDCAASLAERLEGFTLEELRRHLETQPLIEQAKGVLIRQFRCDAEAAFAVLRRWSMAENIKVWVLAAQLVDVAQQPGEALEHYLNARDCGWGPGS